MSKVLTARTPGRNMHRFINSSRNWMLGDTVPIRRWGRIGTDGQRRFDIYSDIWKANLCLAELVRLKQRRASRGCFRLGRAQGVETLKTAERD